MTLGKPRRRDNGSGLKKPSKSAGIVAKALGKFDFDRVTEDARDKHNLVRMIEEDLQEHENYGYYRFDRSAGYHFTPSRLRKILPDLRRCATTFSDGHPTFVCRESLICPFCSRSHAQAVRDLYYRIAFKRLTKNQEIRAYTGAILCEPCPDDAVHDEFLNFKKFVREVREDIRIQQRGDRNLGTAARHSAVCQLDFFIHLSTFRTARSTLYRPHLHYVFQMTDPFTSTHNVTKYLEAANKKYGYRYGKKEEIRMRPTRRRKVSPEIFHFAQTGRYFGQMIKPKVDANTRLLAISSMARGFRQRTRKDSSEKFEELEESFARDQAKGEFTIHFDADSGLWIPE